jgi:23S rRNA (guanine745-N1)-methyltransferase
VPTESLPQALLDVTALLRCPTCQQDLEPAGKALRCSNGHSYDVARQGYVNLLPGDAKPGTADTADMVRARHEFLESGHYRALVDAIVAAARPLLRPGDVVVDAGAGTGHYLRAVLEASPQTSGIALDLSKFAARVVARAQIPALVADLWRPLPLRTGVATLLLNVFAPRNPAEFHRVLRPAGSLLVVTPGPGHLAELIGPLGLISVDDRKAARLQQALTQFEQVASTEIEMALRLSHQEIEQIVRMGPSAHHLDRETLQGRITALDTPATVTASFVLSVFRPLGLN